MKKKDFLSIAFSMNEDDNFIFQGIFYEQFKKHAGLFFSFIEPDQRYSKEQEEVILHKIGLILEAANTKTKLVCLEKLINDKVFTMKKQSNLKNELKLLIGKISERIYYEGSNDDYSLLSFLIFNEKNLEYLKNIVHQKPSLLRCLDREGKPLFHNVLEKYLTLDELNLTEQNYYFQVLSFLFEQESDHIMQNKFEYMTLIWHHGDVQRPSIKRILNLFQNEKHHDLETLCDKYNINLSFEEVKSSNIVSLEERYDFTNQEVLTIDSEDDLCLDDGFYIEKENDFYTLYIHISDLPSLVRPGGVLDRQAYRRAETIYLNNMVIPMIPEDISDDLGSILPSKNTNVITYIFKFDQDFNLFEEEFKIVKGKIKSKHKLNYLKADQIIKSDPSHELHFQLLTMYLISMKLKENNPDKEIYRKLENMLDLYHNDLKRHESVITELSCSANIVQEFMILVNKMIAEYFYRHGLPFVYRVHQFYDASNPPVDFLEFKDRIKQNNLNLDNYEHFLKIIPQLLLNARYSSSCLPHQGLNIAHYSHTTSPARRYADVINEQLIYRFLFQDFTDQDIYTWEALTKEKAQYLNERKKQNNAFAEEYHRLIKKR